MEGNAVDYLVFKLGWYIAAAFVIGVAVGWWAGGRPRTERN
jgi:hypothetical protein